MPNCPLCKFAAHKSWNYIMFYAEIKGKTLSKIRGKLSDG